MTDLISRQAAIDVLCVGAELLKRVLDDTDAVGQNRETYSWGLGVIESFINDINEIPSAQPEIIYCKDCKHGVHAGCGNTYLCVVSPENRLEHKYDFWCAYAERRTE